ncbi:hypothetical protein D3C77_48700 [compost metagenome]
MSLQTDYAVLADVLRDYANGETGSLDPAQCRAFLKNAADAITVLNSPTRNDFAHYQSVRTDLALARQQAETASVRVELAQMRERCAELTSQAQPLDGLQIDREKVRQVLNYVQCGRLK